MIDLVKLIRNVVLVDCDRQDQYLVLQLTLGCSRHTAKRLLFAWIYRAEQGTLSRILLED